MLQNNPVSIEELRTNLADIISRVAYANDRVVVKRYNRNAAIIISLDEYEKLMDPTKRLSKTEWEQHVRKFDRIRSRIPAIDPDELEREIDKAVKEVRVEKRAKGE